MGIQSAGDSVPETLVRILHWAEEGNFRFENHLPVPEHRNLQQQTCISPEPGAKANWQWVEWAECSLNIGRGYWVQVFSLILDSPVGVSVGIQSAGDSVPETLVRILHSAEEDKLSPFDSKIACLCQSIEILSKSMTTRYKLRVKFRWTYLFPFLSNLKIASMQWANYFHRTAMEIL